VPITPQNTIQFSANGTKGVEIKN